MTKEKKYQAKVMKAGINFCLPGKQKPGKVENSTF